MKSKTYGTKTRIYCKFVKGKNFLDILVSFTTHIKLYEIVFNAAFRRSCKLHAVKQIFCNIKPQYVDYVKHRGNE